MIPIMLVITIAILIRNFLYHKRMQNRVIDSRSLKKSESKTVQGIISESSDNVNNVIFRSNKIFGNVIQGLSKEDTDKKIDNCEINWILQKTPMGFGDALLSAQKYVNDDAFLLHAGDTYFPRYNFLKDLLTKR